MIEKHFVIELSDPVLFYGVNNANIKLLRALFPKLRIMARDTVIKVIGSEEEMSEFEETFPVLDRHCAKFNRLNEEDVVHIVHKTSTRQENAEDIILYSAGGKPITPRSANQRRLVEAYSSADLLFAVGPAGSGKTYTAIALAVRALKNKEIKRIILCRPAVEAGEKLGFLPGDMKDKIDPYLQPLYYAFLEIIPATKLQDYMESDVIQIAPLAFMRGRTLNDAVVILDEAQNTTTAQIKMFLTRMGRNTKMIVTGDCTQIDLPLSQKSGLVEACRILKDVPDIAFIFMNEKDIIRHRLVTRIVKAYEQDTARQRDAHDVTTDAVPKRRGKSEKTSEQKSEASEAAD